jgi:hypothetical protein
MLMPKLAAPAVLAMTLVAVPSTSTADVWLTPYIGSSLSTDFGGFDPGRALHYGGALTWLGSSGLGFEIDYAYAPNFFEPGGEDFFDFDGDGNLTTLMGNIIWAVPTPGVRPYVSGGFGLMRSRLEAPLDVFTYSESGFGVNAGVGVRIGGPSVGLRGDLRYFRQIDDISPIRSIDLGDFNYWRGTVGLSLAW